MARFRLVPFGMMLALAACETGGDGGMMPGEGLIGDSLLNPFPSRLLMADGKIAIPPSEIPVPVEGTVVDVGRLSWRTGFSPSQVAVVWLDDPDPSGFPHWTSEDLGQGSVKLVDLTAGGFLPCHAELDAHPDAETAPSVLIRPQVGLPIGHDIAVVITTEVVPRPERFDALVTGAPPTDLEPWAAHFVALLQRLALVGIDSEEVALAWDFPIGDGTIPLRTALDARSSPGAWTLDDVRDRDAGDDLPPLTLRAATGTFEAPDYLDDDQMLNLTDDGTAEPVGGMTSASLYLHVPESVADYPAGTVPVMVFGHGFLSEPNSYLADNDDPSGVLALVDEGGFLVVGTTWRGLSAPDIAIPLSVAADFGQFPRLSGAMVQGQINTRALLDLVVDGDLLEDPALSGTSGQPLGDPDQVFFYGISLGGIAGGVLLAQEGVPVRAGVLHVPGAQWSTMLERSSNWTSFEIFLVPSVPDPRERQVLYALSQLWWDAVDPMSYATELAQTTVLLQEAVGDEQVPNMTTRALARTTGVPLVNPAPDPVWGQDTLDAPTSPGALGMAQFDPETALPVDANRPAEITEAHTMPRLWGETRGQTLAFLNPEAPGTVIHPCGDEPCTAGSVSDEP